jgi:hypothetical protein
MADETEDGTGLGKRGHNEDTLHHTYSFTYIYIYAGPYIDMGNMQHILPDIVTLLQPRLST